MRFAICNELFEGWSWHSVCELASSLGYDQVEVAPFTFAPDVRGLSTAERESIRSEAESFGLSIVGLHWLLLSPPGLHVTTTDASVRKQTSDYLVELAKLCRDLGGNVLVLGSPKQRNPSPDLAHEDAVHLLMETLHPALDVAAEAGITLCLEPLPAEDTSFLNTLDEVAQVLSEHPHPAMRTVLDVKSMGAETTAIPDLVRRHACRAAHFHANDVNRRGPGDGPTDFVPIVTALTEQGYQGAISVEVFDYTPDPVTIARNSIEYLRRAAQT